MINALALVSFALTTFTFTDDSPHVGVVDWFRQRESLVTFDPDLLCVTVLNEDRSLAQGIFNTTTGNFVDGRTVPAARVPPDIREIHRDNVVVVWQ
ncbi:hypothetical protein I6A60_30880 [Frankia sp. AgB1.9]|uniref:hypothetical protein n=1 Tax=unclassified Frankia TaxID=2632575 RepID=UPI0019328116|nr:MULTISPECIES: hypothetical protein [unclassified Frankia]MBL7490809.1 hypothetical protein [Frankia sp. AgW1.1]MBL7552234.1 hypothetical protein [Frankia sp. AgB1.9]MBL7622007.1 hypothetical protein [Frankia sp. AgB1.8]